MGVLHSLTGDLTSTEKPVLDATLMALEELQAEGGLLGRPIEIVVKDGESSPDIFARGAEELITLDKVDVIFGCWTSATRKTVLPVLGKYRHLLVYPVQYEGLEESPYVVYTGAAPNQQLIPGIKWSVDNQGQRVFLVGSDYAYPRAANEIAREQLAALGAEVVGEEYLLLGSEDTEELVAEIRKSDADLIVNNLVGITLPAFFKELREQGVTPGKIPTMSFTLSENDLQQIDPKLLAGDYATWNYFQTLDTPRNREFVKEFRRKYGRERVVDDTMVSGYSGVKIWAQAVREAESSAPEEVRLAIRDQSYLSPGGIVYIDGENQHTWKNVRVGKILPDGQFEIVWDSGKPIRPIPFPLSRTETYWQAFLEDLYKSWGGRWYNPGNL